MTKADNLFAGFNGYCHHPSVLIFKSPSREGVFLTKIQNMLTRCKFFMHFTCSSINSRDENPQNFWDLCFKFTLLADISFISFGILLITGSFYIFFLHSTYNGTDGELPAIFSSLSMSPWSMKDEHPMKEGYILLSCLENTWLKKLL